MRTIKAAVSRLDNEHLHFEELSLQDPRADEVVVEVAYSGICHTDIIAHSGAQGTHLPAVLGHEGVGIVAAVGLANTDFAVGDRVAMTRLVCGHCKNCISGDPTYCQHSRTLNMNAERLDHSSGYHDSDVHSHFFGQSSFATFSLANQRNLVKIPDFVPLLHAAAMGCGVLTGSGTVFHALKMRPGDSLLVMGAGAVGLSAVMAAKISGASQIIAVDFHDSRLELARTLGATDVFNARDEDLVEKIRAVSNGGVNFSIEASGSLRAFAPAIDSLATRGMCALVGAAGNVEAGFRWGDLQRRGLTIRGVISGDANMPIYLPKLFKYYKDGRFPVDKMIKLYEFDQINQAMEDSESGAAVKPVLRISRTTDADNVFVAT
jgi:aryl-alcohol dehydrogenase